MICGLVRAIRHETIMEMQAFGLAITGLSSGLGVSLMIRALPGIKWQWDKDYWCLRLLRISGIGGC